ncbi:FtsX-like permease family protein [Cellulomonas sp. P5_C5]
MRTVVLAGVRANGSRLVATGVAVVLSVAFLVATLAVSATFLRSTESSLTAGMANADVWVGVTDDAVLPTEGGDALLAQLPVVRSAAHVVAADAEQSTFGELRVGGVRSSAMVGALLDEPLRWQQLSSGVWPQEPTQTTLDAAAASSLGVVIGDSVSVRPYGVPAVSLTVVGLTSDEGAAIGLDVPRLLVTREALVATGAVAVASEILVRGDGAPDSEVATGVSAALGSVPGMLVLTRAEAVQHRVAQLAGSATVLTAGLLGFCAIALLVAAIVIANTFHVLVAQRTKELALLRCIGAGTGQVYRLVLGEAAVLGGIASVLGVAVGLPGALLLTAVGGLSGGLVVSPVVPVAGVLVGVLLTVVAAWPPARRATRVLPAEALRPVDVIPADRRGGLVRLAAAALLLVAGAVGAVAATVDGGFALAFPAAALSFLGVLLVAPYLVPWCVGGVGALVARVSAPARLAAVNATRNRRRTTATATALLVGVTFVTMMVVATASVRSSVNAEIDTSRPIDLVVVSSDEGGVSAAVRAAVAGLPEVAGTAEVTGGFPVVLAAADGPTSELTARGVDPAATQRVAHAPVVLPGPGAVLVHPDDAGALRTGQTVQVSSADGATDAVVETSPNVRPGTITMRADELTSVLPAPPVAEVQVRLAPGLTGAEVQGVVTTVLTMDDRLDVGGGAPERAMYAQILDAMLLVVLALLTIAVVIAVVGIGNTMALSVVERRRESAVLRALGLTVRQLRGMLAVEAALIAVVAAGLGASLGIGYAWTGVMALGEEATKLPMHLDVPVGSVLTIVALAVLAGVVASLLPGRRAGRVSPVEALAVD